MDSVWIQSSESRDCVFLSNFDSVYCHHNCISQPYCGKRTIKSVDCIAEQLPWDHSSTACYKKQEQTYNNNTGLMMAEVKKEYRWCLVVYDDTQELYRHAGDRWFDNLAECKKHAEKLDFDFCYGFVFEYEERVKTKLPSLE